MITSHVSYICCISAISKNKVGLLRIVVIKPGACSGIGKGGPKSESIFFKIFFFLLFNFSGEGAQLRKELGK